MAGMQLGSAFGWVAPLFKFSRQTRSPHLLTVLFCIAGLIVLNGLFGDLPKYQIQIVVDDFIIEPKVASTPENKSIPLANKFYYWYLLAIPLAIVLYLLTKLTLANLGGDTTSKLTLSNTGGDATSNRQSKKLARQMKLAFSFCMSSGILSLVYGGTNLIEENNDVLFWILFLTCFVQIVVFLIFTAIDIHKDQLKMDLRQFHSALITTSLFVGATICMIQINHTQSSDNSNFIIDTFVDANTNIDPFAITALFFYLLWGFCIKSWIIMLQRVLLHSDSTNST